MKKTLATLLTAASIIGMFWVNVSPDLKTICASNKRFGNTVHSDSGNDLVTRAKARHCQVTTTKS